ncbi:hypothetical protein MRX96_030648 [Rhipicephalus microplus]
MADGDVVPLFEMGDLNRTLGGSRHIRRRRRPVQLRGDEANERALNRWIGGLIRSQICARGIYCCDPADGVFAEASHRPTDQVGRDKSRCRARKFLDIAKQLLTALSRSVGALLSRRASAVCLPGRLTRGIQKEAPPAEASFKRASVGAGGHFKEAGRYGSDPVGTGQRSSPRLRGFWGAPFVRDPLDGATIAEAGRFFVETRPDVLTTLGPP